MGVGMWARSVIQDNGESNSVSTQWLKELHMQKGKSKVKNYFSC